MSLRINSYFPISFSIYLCIYSQFMYVFFSLNVFPHLVYPQTFNFCIIFLHFSFIKQAHCFSAVWEDSITLELSVSGLCAHPWWGWHRTCPRSRDAGWWGCRQAQYWSVRSCRSSPAERRTDQLSVEFHHCCTRPTQRTNTMRRKDKKASVRLLTFCGQLPVCHMLLLGLSKLMR